jgi:hypothetical protein
MNLFLGDYKKRNNINLGGSRSSKTKEQLLIEAHLQRNALEQQRLQNHATIKIQVNAPHLEFHFAQI